ncbi:MAG: GTPase Era [Bdellovibrionota bacterium]
MKTTEKKSFKAGFLGLIGQPNAGKSSLLNFLVKEKISIVTNKPQTTRRRITGLHTAEAGQIVFIDAPGLVKSTSGLNTFLEKEAHDVIRSSDALVAVLSVDEDSAERNEEILELVTKSKKPWVAVITKVDLKETGHRVTILKGIVEKFGGKSITVSNTKFKDDDRKEILAKLIEILPESDRHLYDPEMFTTENVRGLVEEIIREKCFEVLNHEIPYQLAVQIRKFDEEAKPCPKIYADIMVARDSHKPIVVGKGAAVIKEIGQQSRKEIESLMGEKVYLELNVTVKENWFENKQTLKELKYVVDSE